MRVRVRWARVVALVSSTAALGLVLEVTARGRALDEAVRSKDRLAAALAASRAEDPCRACRTKAALWSGSSWSMAAGCWCATSAGRAGQAFGAEGIWYQPPQPWDPASPTIRLPSQPFVFDGEYATVHLRRLKAWMWRTPDDIYRVQTRWKGDVLQWLPPFGTWADLARFEGGRFVDDEGLPFDRVTASELPEDHRALLTPRRPHDYSISPQGTRPGKTVDVDVADLMPRSCRGGW